MTSKFLFVIPVVFAFLTATRVSAQTTELPKPTGSTEFPPPTAAEKDSWSAGPAIIAMFEFDSLDTVKKVAKPLVEKDVIRQPRVLDQTVQLQLNGEGGDGDVQSEKLVVLLAETRLAYISEVEAIVAKLQPGTLVSYLPVIRHRIGDSGEETKRLEQFFHYERHFRTPFMMPPLMSGIGRPLRF